jgi:hypothetical protein
MNICTYCKFKSEYNELYDDCCYMHCKPKDNDHCKRFIDHNDDPTWVYEFYFNSIYPKED